MKINPEFKRFTFLATLAVAGGCTCLASVPMFEAIAPSYQYGGTGTQCTGPFIPSSTMTNSTGGVWIAAPAGMTNAILTDITPNVPTNYVSTVSAMRRSDLMTWCNDNSISFPVTNGDYFELKVYVISGEPTNGPEVLQVTWQ